MPLKFAKFLNGFVSILSSVSMVSTSEHNDLFIPDTERSGGEGWGCCDLICNLTYLGLVCLSGVSHPKLIKCLSITVINNVLMELLSL